MNGINLWPYLVMGLLGVAALTARGQDDSYRSVDKRDCPITGMPFVTDGGWEAGYIFPADTTAAGWQDFSAAELSIWDRFGDWETQQGSDFNLEGLWDSMFLHMKASDSDAFPLTMARLHLVWTQRYEANFSFEGEVSPGYYAAFQTFSGDDFSVPFGGRWILPLNPNIAVFAGANIYPTFDQVIDPKVGVRLAHRDNVILDLGYPESRFAWRPGRSFRFTSGIRWSNWPEYNLGDDPRQRLRYDETRISARAEFGVGEFTLLGVEVGSVMQRKISFDAASEDVSIDDAVYAKFGISRML